MQNTKYDNMRKTDDYFEELLNHMLRSAMLTLQWNFLKLRIPFLLGLLLIPQFALAAENPAPASTHIVNLRLQPLRLIGRVISANLDLVIHPQVTIGPSLVYWHRATSSADDLTQVNDILGYGLGARANWFMNGVYVNSFYAGASFDYATAKRTVSDLKKSVSTVDSSYSSTVLAGYGWFWDPFNLMLGLGWTIPITDSKYSFKDASGYVVRKGAQWTTAEWTLECSTGWTF